MSARFLENDRLADLLVALETEGLGDEDARELDRLLEEEPGASREALAGPMVATILLRRKSVAGNLDSLIFLKNPRAGPLLSADVSVAQLLTIT